MKTTGMDDEGRKQLEALKDGLAAGDLATIKKGKQIIVDANERTALERARKGDSTLIFLGEATLRVIQERGTERSGGEIIP